MFRTSLILTALLSTTLTAQIVTFGGDGERKTSSVFFFDKAENKLAGRFEFTYGSPAWKAEHAKATGSMRLGKDGWATLDNSVPLTIGGVDVPAGHWYLGLRRDEDKYFLMVMKAATLRNKLVPPWETAKVRARINAPLKHEKSESSRSEMLIQAKPGKQDPTKGTFRIVWGNNTLSASLVAHLGAKKDSPTSKKSGKGQK
jgi:hypothetical protein